MRSHRRRRGDCGNCCRGVSEKKQRRRLREISVAGVYLEAALDEPTRHVVQEAAPRSASAWSVVVVTAIAASLVTWMATNTARAPRSVNKVRVGLQPGRTLGVSYQGEGSSTSPLSRTAMVRCACRQACLSLARGSYKTPSPERRRVRCPWSKSETVTFPRLCGAAHSRGNVRCGKLPQSVWKTCGKYASRESRRNVRISRQRPAAELCFSPDRPDPVEAPTSPAPMSRAHYVVD